MEGEVCLEVGSNNNSNETDILKSSIPGSKKRSGDSWTDLEALSPNKKQVNEVSNEDVHSEVSNPYPPVSPAEIVSCSKTQPTTDMDSSVRGSEITSEKSAEESLECVDERPRDGASGSEPTSRVTLEIPEHVSSTGIRKITFKLKRIKEECCKNDKSTSYSVHSVNFQENKSSERHFGRCGNEFATLYVNAKSSTSKKSGYPSNVKKLLSTGILDGAQVKYISPSKKKELSGTIHGGGYLCSCPACNFTRVLSAYEFEMHAGGSTRHPNSYIYLENGKPIYSIIPAMKTAPVSMLDDVIKEVAGSSLNETNFQIWKAKFEQSSSIAAVDHKTERSSSWSSFVSQVTTEAGASRTSTSSVGFFPFRPEMHAEVPHWQHLGDRPNTSIGKKGIDGLSRRRYNDLHRLLFMPNGLPDGADLAYYMKGKHVLGGYKQGYGIVCSCCNKEISPSQFEAHAGWATRRQPYRHIFTSSGISLHDVAISLARGQNITTDDGDGGCAVCGHSADLSLCGGCPRAFHAACLDLSSIPEGEWLCPYCTDANRFSTKVGDPLSVKKPIIIRLNRVVKASECESGGCVVCRAPDFSVAKFDDRTIILCDQCEKEYHVGCLRESGLCDLKELPEDKWFCCAKCEEIHTVLQNIVSRGTETIPASLSSIVFQKLAVKGCSSEGEYDVQWRILSGKSRNPENLPFLSRAAAIFRECFDPIVAQCGRDLIPLMVYGRNISGQEFGGLYCVVLIVKSVVVSAGLLRVFGRDVAELPIVATAREHQGKGYFQALFSCMETLLVSLNVENLVLPAAEEAESIWTKKFGFRKMSAERLRKYTRDYQLTVFRDTSVLEREVKRTSR